MQRRRDDEALDTPSAIRLIHSRCCHTTTANAARRRRPGGDGQPPLVLRGPVGDGGPTRPRRPMDRWTVARGCAASEASTAAACCPAAADAAREEALRQSVFDDRQRFQRHACNAARPLLVDSSHHTVSVHVCSRMYECVRVSLYFCMFVLIICLYLFVFM